MGMIDFTVIFSCRKVNDLIIDSISIFKSAETTNNFQFLVVSNQICEEIDGVDLIFNPFPNAAIARDLGVKYSIAENLIFIDDDIVFSVKDLLSILEYTRSCQGNSIIAPYIEGHFLNIDYNLPKIKSLFLFNKLNLKYSHIEGKSKFGIAFPLILAEHVKRVDWLPGGFLIFKEVGKSKISFSEPHFNNNYYLEDYHLTNKLFRDGVDLFVFPVLVGHRINYDKQKSNLCKQICESVKFEENRIKSYVSLNDKSCTFKYKFIHITLKLLSLRKFNIPNLGSLIGLILVFCNLKWKK
jgi:hypothetical protein